MASLITLPSGVTLNTTDRLYIVRDPTGTPADDYITGAMILEAVLDKLATSIVGGDGITVTPNDGADTITFAFNGTVSTKYQPGGTAEALFFPANIFQPGNVATASLAVEGSAGLKVWRLDAALNEDLAMVTILPSWWVTYAIDVWWTNVGAGSGNVVFQPKHYEDSANAGTNAGNGDNFAAPAAYVNTATKTTVAAPALDIIKTTTIATALTRITDLTIVNIARLGADAGDTLANDIGVIGLNFRRLT